MHRCHQISCTIQFACAFTATPKYGTFQVDITFRDLSLDIFKTIGTSKNVAYTTFVFCCCELHDKNVENRCVVIFGIDYLCIYDSTSVSPTKSTVWLLVVR